MFRKPEKVILDIEDIIDGKSYEIVSISRRTDIPGCYLREFLKSLKEKQIIIPNPKFPKKVYRVSLDPNIVKVIAWWSKNYKVFIKAFKKDEGLLKSYSHYFNFTVNGESELESISTSLAERFDQIIFLKETFGVNSLNIRFDPIVHYRYLTDDIEIIRDNLEDFEKIITVLGELEIPDVTFSFCEKYPKVVKNMKDCGFILITLSLDQQQKVLDNLLLICKENNVKMKCCCSSSVLGYEGKFGGKVEASACIDKDKIEKLLGRKLKSRARDAGQRKECNCVISRDLGKYDQACAHGCTYCYSNPILKEKNKRKI